MSNHIRVIIALIAIIVIMVTSGRVPERIGDKLQIALPVAAFGCAIAGGDGVRFFGRYLLLEAGIKIPKHTLGDADINQRPNGGLHGFPSGHTSAATFGAVGLATTCMKQSRVGQGIVLTAAAYTGASRIEADKHTIWQVLAGGIWGWFAQLAVLVTFDRWFAKLAAALGRGLRAIKRALTRAVS